MNKGQGKIVVTFFQRKSYDFHFSIEKIFDGVRKHLPGNIVTRIHFSPYHSQRFIPRLKNLFHANREQKENDINHITGDIHYIALALKKRKTILTIHDIGFVYHPSRLARWILILFWLRIPIHRSSMVTTISQATKDHILQYVKCNPDKIKVIPDFLTSPFVQVDKEFNEDYPVILQVGTKFNKNIERVIQALDGIKCKFHIIGKLTDQQKELLQKTQIDYQNESGLSEEELIKRYESCDMITFCSTLEGFGLPVLEAQTVGRVIITSNISSMPEVAGAGAVFVDPFDVSSIRRGILSVIQDKNLREHIIDKGFENLKRYDPDKIAQQYADLYEKLLVLVQ